MRRLPPSVIVAAVAMIVPPLAQGGDSITTLPSCAHSTVPFQTGASRAQFRASLLCLINAARKTEHLPALKRSAPLESAGQSRADTFARSGVRPKKGSTTQRFAQFGYRASVSNEGIEALDPDSTPYAFLAASVAHHDAPCTAIFDPRLRDIGIGVAARDQAAVFDASVIEVGLKAGAHAPSKDSSAAASCPHLVPKKPSP